MDFSGVRQCQTTDANRSFHETVPYIAKQAYAATGGAMRGKGWRDCRALVEIEKVPSRHLATLEKETVVKLKNVAAK